MVMKKFLKSFAGLLLVFGLVSCSPREQSVREKEDIETQEVMKPKTCVYSLYENTENGSFQIYRDGEKFSSFSLAAGRRPLCMKLYSGDCYVLISSFEKDSVSFPSEIFKNGRQAMFFEKGFSASDFDVQGGHFYVLGGFSDTLISVFRDGLRKISIRNKGAKPLGLAVSGDDIYFSVEKNSVTEVYKNSEKIYEISGHCVNFEISDGDVYALSGGKIYRNEQVFMGGDNRYKFFDSELRAFPECFSVCGRECYTGVSAVLEGGKSYAAVFHNREHFMTVKPDDKPLGKSAFLTHCLAVSATSDGVYFVTENVGAKDGERQNVFHYYFNSTELFTVEPLSKGVKLLAVKGN